MDEVIMIYTEFRSAGVQKVTGLQLLPLVSFDKEGSAEELTDVFTFEPSEEAVFEQLLPKNIEVQIFRALLDSAASEEAARMAAMENATKSADDMIKRLTLQYNKARQASITKELMDIVGGVEALKK
jgi:F-type H+-transporting ATPase subunit gamma